MSPPYSPVECGIGIGVEYLGVVFDREPDFSITPRAFVDVQPLWNLAKAESR